MKPLRGRRLGLIEAFRVQGLGLLYEFMDWGFEVVCTGSMWGFCTGSMDGLRVEGRSGIGNGVRVQDLGLEGSSESQKQFA